MKRWLLLLSLLLIPTLTSARGKLQGWCEQGGNALAVPSVMTSSIPTNLQGSYPSCTVTVYVTGTLTLATLYSDNAGTAQANPFTASATGQWSFYANNGRYDVRLAGTNLTTFTLSDLLVQDGATLTYGTVTFSATPTFDYSLYQIFNMTLTGNVTSSTISNSVTGGVAEFNLCQDGTGSRTFVWPTSFLRPPALSLGASSCTNSSFFYDGTHWRQLARSGDNLQQTAIVDLQPGDEVGAVINAAFTALGGGGVVDVSGTGTATTTITPTASGQHLKGHGVATVITDGIAGAGAQNPLMLIQNLNDIEIDGFKFVGSATTGNLLSVINNSSSYGRYRIHNNEFTSTTGTGKNHVGSSITASAIYAYDVSSEFRPRENNFNGNGIGIYLDTSAANAENASSIFQNKFISQTADGIYCANTQAPLGTPITENQFEGNGGWAINADCGMTGLTISGNYFEENALGDITFNLVNWGVSIAGNFFSHTSALKPAIFASTGS